MSKATMTNPADATLVIGLYTHIAYLAGDHPKGDDVTEYFSSLAHVRDAEETLVSNLKAGKRFDARAAAIVLTGEKDIPKLSEIRELKDLWIKNLDEMLGVLTATPVAAAA